MTKKAAKKKAASKPRKVIRDVWLARVDNYDSADFGGRPAIELFIGKPAKRSEHVGFGLFMPHGGQFLGAIDPEAAKAVFASPPIRHGQRRKFRITTERLP